MARDGSLRLFWPQNGHNILGRNSETSGAETCGGTTSANVGGKSTQEQALLASRARAPAVDDGRGTPLPFGQLLHHVHGQQGKHRSGGGTMAPDMAQILKPGHWVPTTGVYQVVHEKDHVPPHHVTAISGSRSPDALSVKTASVSNSSWQPCKWPPIPSSTDEPFGELHILLRKGLFFSTQTPDLRKQGTAFRTSQTYRCQSHDHLPRCLILHHGLASEDDADGLGCLYSLRSEASPLSTSLIPYIQSQRVPSNRLRMRRIREVDR